MDHLCVIAEEIILQDHYDKIRTFERTGGVVEMNGLKEDLIYLFKDYRINYITHLEEPLFDQLFDHYIDLEALIH
jgi:hypothetical protein